VAGNVLFGISVVRAKIFPRWAGLVVAGTVVVPIAYLAGASVHVVAIGGGVAGAGQVWLGAVLLRVIPATRDY
jgi:hypothetical protein